MKNIFNFIIFLCLSVTCQAIENEEISLYEAQKVCETIKENTFKLRNTIYLITLSDKNEIEIKTNIEPPLEEKDGEEEEIHLYNCQTNPIDISDEWENVHIICNDSESPEFAIIAFEDKIEDKIVIKGWKNETNGINTIKEIQGKNLIPINACQTYPSFYITKDNKIGNYLFYINSALGTVLEMEEDFSINPPPIYYKHNVFYFVKKNDLYVLNLYNNAEIRLVLKNDETTIIEDIGIGRATKYLKLKKGEMIFYKFFNRFFEKELFTKNNIISFCYFPDRCDNLAFGLEENGSNSTQAFIQAEYEEEKSVYHIREAKDSDFFCCHFHEFKKALKETIQGNTKSFEQMVGSLDNYSGNIMETRKVLHLKENVNSRS